MKQKTSGLPLKCNLFIHLFIFALLIISLSIYLCVYLFIYELFIYLFIYLCICSFIYAFIYLFLYLCIVYLFMRFFIIFYSSFLLTGNPPSEKYLVLFLYCLFIYAFLYFFIYPDGEVILKVFIFFNHCLPIGEYTPGVCMYSVITFYQHYRFQWEERTTISCFGFYLHTISSCTNTSNLIKCNQTCEPQQ